MPSTPLPPDDGENKDASALPTGLRLSDAEQIAALHRDGAAESSPTSTAPLPPHDGESNNTSVLPTSLHLSEAGQIAAQRLDGAGHGTPIAITTLSPARDGESNQASELPTNLRLSDAEQIAAHRLDGTAEGSLREALALAPAGDVANSASSLVDRVEAVGERLAAEPQAPPIDAMLAAGSSHTQPMAEHAPVPPTALPVDASVAALKAEAVGAAGPATAEAPVDGRPTLEPTQDLQAPAGAAPLLDAGAPEAVHPLASALDAAAKLAADANAAAEALENLKRLLERQRPPPAVAASPAPAATEVGTRVSADAPAAPAASAMPPPLPLHPVRDASGRSTLRPAVLAPPPAPPRRMPIERTRLDVRGFLAGFALSWAFGIVLYLFMSAG